MHRRPFAAIEQAKLNGGRIGQDTHRTTQAIDLANDLPLGHAADRRVAAHLADRVAIRGEEGRPEADSRGCERGFHPCVAGADNQDVKVIWVVHSPRPFFKAPLTTSRSAFAAANLIATLSLPDRCPFDLTRYVCHG